MRLQPLLAIIKKDSFYGLLAGSFRDKTQSIALNTCQSSYILYSSLHRAGQKRGMPPPPMPGRPPFMPPSFFIIFIRPPPFIFFIIPCI